jgi:hypothetical protein
MFADFSFHLTIPIFRTCQPLKSCLSCFKPPSPRPNKRRGSNGAETGLTGWTGFSNATSAGFFGFGVVAVVLAFAIKVQQFQQGIQAPIGAGSLNLKQ